MIIRTSKLRALFVLIMVCLMVIVLGWIAVRVLSAKDSKGVVASEEPVLDDDGPAEDKSSVKSHSGSSSGSRSSGRSTGASSASRNIAEIMPLRSHPNYAILRSTADFNEIQNKRFVRIRGDGACFYYSFIVAAYEKLRNRHDAVHDALFDNGLPEGTIPNGRYDSQRDAAISILEANSSFTTLSTADFQSIVLFIKYVIAREVMSNEVRYGPTVLDGTLRRKVDRMVSSPGTWADDTAVYGLQNVISVLDFTVVTLNPNKRVDMVRLNGESHRFDERDTIYFIQYQQYGSSGIIGMHFDALIN